MTAIATRLEANYPATNRGRDIKLWALWQTPFNNASTLLPTLEIMVVVVAFVLLIACANVGNLLLVRSFARRHEMTIRMAIGATGGRLLRQLLTEGLILAAFGATGGLMVAYWCRHALALLFPVRSGMAMFLPGEIDWHVMLLSSGICLMATLVLGLVPAFQSRNIDLAGALKSESSGITAARRSVDALGLGHVPGLPEFYFVGWSRALARESAKDSNHKPGLFHEEGGKNECATGGSGI
jgi:ABC-type lipoprotein release transport system permease subunit